MKLTHWVIAQTLKFSPKIKFIVPNVMWYSILHFLGQVDDTVNEHPYIKNTTGGFEFESNWADRAIMNIERDNISIIYSTPKSDNLNMIHKTIPGSKINIDHLFVRKEYAFKDFMDAAKDYAQAIKTIRQKAL